MENAEVPPNVTYAGDLLRREAFHPYIKYRTTNKKTRYGEILSRAKAYRPFSESERLLKIQHLSLAVRHLCRR